MPSIAPSSAPIHRSESIADQMRRQQEERVHQAVNQAVNQAVSQPASPPVNQTVNHLQMNEAQNQPVHHAATQETEPPTQHDVDRSPPQPPELPRWATRGTSANDGISDARFAAFIGHNWAGTYSRKLQKFRDDPSFVPTWNWAAAAFTPFWFLYRKLYLAFAVFWILPGVVFRYLTGSDQQLTPESLSKLENQPLAIMIVAVFLSTAIAAGGTANWLLFRRARAASAIVSMQHLPEDASLSLLHRIGGVNRVPTLVFLVCSMVLAIATVMSSSAPR